MIFDWMKYVIPRGLYGRAALILVAPIVIIQLVVSIGFIQRHFEDVTRQMTENIVLELAYLEERLAAAPDGLSGAEEVARIGKSLGIDFALPAIHPEPDGDQRVFYDFSGLVVMETMRAGNPNIRSFDLSNLRRVQVWISTPFGLAEAEFDRRRVSASNPHQLLVLMMATGLLMTVIAFIFLRNQLRPIRRLARAAEAFGKGHAVPYKPSGAIEVRAAGNAFLDMRARIERQIEQRTLLLSGVSHDLRTPLTRLKLGLSMMEANDEAEAMAGDIEEMERLLESFLAFVRKDATEEETQTVDPVELVRGVVEDARRGGQAAVLFAAEGAGQVRLRPDAIRRALQNLIGNAVRYGTRAELSVAILERSVRFSVEDDGPGIPRDRRDEALRPFTRLDTARNQDRGSGVGLGLAITADIARSHGGTLRLGESTRLGGLKAEIVLAR